MNHFQLYVFFVCAVIAAANTEVEILPNCIGCKGDQPELNEILKTQRIAHRTDYIKQQLMNYLPVENLPKKPPKYHSLPNFIIDELIHPGISDGSVDGNEDVANRQMVLFAEEENRNCSPERDELCLKFKLSEEIFTTDISSVTLWFPKNLIPGNENETHNLTVVDNSILNAKNRYARNLTSYLVEDKDGWYQIEVIDFVKLWQRTKNQKHRTLKVVCDSCTDAQKQIFGFQGNTTERTFFMLLNMVNEKNSRSKRGVECTARNNECCRDDLIVDLQTLGGFTTVLTPTKFNAHICRGNCFIQSVVDTGNTYATLLTMLKLRNDTSEYSLPTTCCTPTKFSDLKILYATDNLIVKTLTIQNMIVDSCGCI